MDYEKIVYLIIGALIGFVLSLLKDLLIEKNKNKIKNIELRRERLEELYIDFSKWLNRIVSHFLTLQLVMDNKLIYNQYLDLNIETKKDFDAQRIDMIIKVYSNSLIPLDNIVREQLEYLNQIEDDYKKEYELYGQHTTKEIYKSGINLYLKNFVEASEKLKKELALEILNSNY